MAAAKPFSALALSLIVAAACGPAPAPEHTSPEARAADVSKSLAASASVPASAPASGPTSGLTSGQDAVYASGLYDTHCAVCHDGGLVEAPTRAALELLDANTIYASMTTGVMREQARMLTSYDKEYIATWLGAAATDAARRAAPAPLCAGALELVDGPGWTRWGQDVGGARFQATDAAGIDAITVSSLRLKWAFAFPGAARARSQPAVTPTALFTGSQDGTVYALDPDTACVWWRFFADAEVRTAPLVEAGPDGTPKTIYFGDFNATLYAVDARTGEERWRLSMRDEHPVATITGSPALHDGRLYVPLSSAEVVSAYSPDYPCCTFRGSVTAVNAQTGAVEWRFYTVPDPRPTHLNDAGVQSYGPSGVPVWSAPTLDAERGLLYVGTGQNYSSPATELSSAVLALRLDDGALAWVFQPEPGDAWNGACGTTNVNCPQEDGPDFDFGAAPMLVSSPGQDDILIAGQKSGLVFGLDPDTGAQVWRARAGKGGFNGGVHWGMATDGTRAFVGVADTPGIKFATGPARPGVQVFDARTGALMWERQEEPRCTEPERQCMAAMSAPLTLTPDLVFAGSLNGVLHAYRAADGAPLWRYDTLRDFDTVNGAPGRGGAIDSAGPVVAGGRLFVNSGYDKFGNLPGNVLLAFEIAQSPDAVEDAP